MSSWIAFTSHVNLSIRQWIGRTTIKLQKLTGKFSRLMVSYNLTSSLWLWKKWCRVKNMVSPDNVREERKEIQEHCCDISCRGNSFLKYFVSKSSTNKDLKTPAAITFTISWVCCLKVKKKQNCRKYYHRGRYLGSLLQSKNNVQISPFWHPKTNKATMYMLEVDSYCASSRLYSWLQLDKTSFFRHHVLQPPSRLALEAPGGYQTVCIYSLGHLSC